MLNATQIRTADLGEGVLYAHVDGLLVMNVDEHLAKIPAARNLMQRPVSEAGA